MELLTWITPVPDGVDEGDLILAALARRLERGAYAIDDEDALKGALSGRPAKLGMMIRAILTPQPFKLSISIFR